MKKLGLGKRVLACAVSAATLLTGTTAISAVTQLGSVTASASSYDNYAKLLQYSMYFYDGNMCGTEAGETSQFTWRDDCHTSDQVTGGFHDAGDHVKFGLPAGYSASTLGWGYYEYKDVYDSLGQTSHLKTITDYFAQYFKDCTTLSGGTVTNFVYQIGNGDQDHNEWCAPEDQGSSSRQVYSTTNGASDIAAEYAAALAVNYINFGNTEDLTYAKALYEFSTKYNTVTDEGTSGFYTSYDYYDDQAWAAGWLYLATGDSTYKTFLNTFMNANGQGKSGSSGCLWGVYSPHSWNNVSLGAAILQSEITGSSSDWSKVTTYLNSKCTSESTYYCEDSWGSARYNTTMQLCALVTSKYSASGKDYSSWAKAQMAMILGNNSANTNFVVGFDSNSAKYAHHRAASGYDSSSEMSNQTGYASDGHTLVGALVGGPTDSNFTYSDTVQDYQCNEVALDYNAGIVGAAAGLYETYGTGSIDTGTIEGTSGKTVVTTTTTQQATTTTAQETTTATVATTKATVATTKATTAATTQATVATTATNSGNSGTNASFTTGTQTGTDGDTQMYAEFAPNGAKTATLYYTISTSDTSSSGAFGTWNNEWLQEDFEVTVGSNGQCVATYTIPSNVGSTIKAMIFYPSASSVTIDKIVLDEDSSSVTTANSGDVEASITTGTQTGTDGDSQLYAEFAPNGAVSATLYYTVSGNDTTSSGGFGTWTGTWEQEDFNVSVVNGQCTAEYTIPSNVGSTVKAMIFYPDSSKVSIQKVVLHYGSSQTTTTTVTKATTTATKATSSSTTKTTTTVSTQGGSGTNASFTTGTQTGEDGDIQAYAEFAPNGAKTATMYYTISTNDTKSSGGFGTWTGTWEQEDFEVTVGSNGQCVATYTIPSNVGSTVKAMIFYPSASNVTINKIVLDESSSSVTTAPNSGDVEASITTGTQTGTKGDTQLYAEFAPNGATSATLYYTVSGNDKTSSGGFGTWTGEWEQEDFSVSVVNGQCTAEYTIPSNVGSTVKAMIFYPDSSKVSIQKVVLHYGSSSQTTTTVTKATTTATKATTTKTTTTKTTTTKATAASSAATTTTKTTTATRSADWPEASLYGDVNLDGKVQLGDAVLLSKAAADVVSLVNQQKANADCNANNVVDNADTIVLLRFLVGIINTLPDQS